MLTKFYCLLFFSVIRLFIFSKSSKFYWKLNKKRRIIWIWKCEQLRYETRGSIFQGDLNKKTNACRSTWFLKETKKNCCKQKEMQTKNLLFDVHVTKAHLWPEHIVGKTKLQQCIWHNTNKDIKCDKEVISILKKNIFSLDTSFILAILFN